MRNLLIVLTLLGGTTSAQAEVFYRGKEEPVRGALIGEAQGKLIVLTEEGELLLEKAKVSKIDRSHRVSSKLKRKAKKARGKFLRKRQAEVRKALKDYGRSKSKRAQIESALVAEYKPAELIKPLGETLRSKRRASRELALRQLTGMKTKKAVAPLLIADLTSPDIKLRERAYQGAIQMDADLSRRGYEAAAGRGGAGVRLRAIDRVKAIGSRKSARELIVLLEKITMEIHTALGTAGPLRSIPVSLGTTQGSAINVPIEVPELKLLAVSTTISVVSLREVRNATVDALQSVSGERYGKDLKGWGQWWEKQPEAKSGGN